MTNYLTRFSTDTKADGGERPPTVERQGKTEKRKDRDGSEENGAEKNAPQLPRGNYAEVETNLRACLPYSHFTHCTPSAAKLSLILLLFFFPFFFYLFVALVAVIVVYIILIGW